MKLFKVFVIFIILTSIKLSAEIIHYSQLPEDIQRTVIPDMDGKVLINDLDSQLISNIYRERELPAVADGWPVSYTGSNCKYGAIYVNMDSDPELEILFGVGTKITALNLDGTTVAGWPVQLSFYISSSPAAGDIDGDGEMEIVCTSKNNTNSNSGELYAFELDGTPCTGFPVTQAGGGTTSVCLFDLDSNGDMEMLVNVRNYPQGWVYVYDGDGSVYPGFPQELDFIPGAGISAGDITGDGIPEIVALSYYQIHVFDLSGTLLDGFPLENPGTTYSYSRPILYDLDNDGLREIIWGGCSGTAGSVFAINQDASSVDGWPQSTNYWIFGTVSIGDIDQDGSLDVVVGDQIVSGTPVNHIFAWDSAGNDIAGFPAGPTNAINAQIGIADLDGDNNVELMIDDNEFGAGYNAYNHDGTQCVDWPLACGTLGYSTTLQITPVFGDVDNDGDLEIMGAATDIMNWVVECYLWDTDAAWNEDLAYMVIDGVNIQHNGLYDPDEAPVFYPPNNFAAEVMDFNDVMLTWDEPVPSNATLLGYKVYRDGSTIIEITDPNTFEYLDEALNGGDYEFEITAVYIEGESIPVGLTNISIVLPAPTDLDAAYNGSDLILLSWNSALNRELESFNVYRNESFIANVADTFYMDSDLTFPITYCYNVAGVFSGGWEGEWSEDEIIEIFDAEQNIISLVTKLSGNHPNPFNPETTISFSVTQTFIFVTIEIYNLKGQKIKTLVNEIISAGQHSVVWNGADDNGKEVSSGIYFYKMKAGNFNQKKKMILLK